MAGGAWVGGCGTGKTAGGGGSGAAGRGAGTGGMSGGLTPFCGNEPLGSGLGMLLPGLLRCNPRPRRRGAPGCNQPTIQWH